MGHQPFNLLAHASFNHQHNDGHWASDRKHSNSSIIQTKAHAMWGDDGKSSQDTIQTIILLIAVVCVPVMLLPKPIIEIKRLNRKR